MQLQYVTSLRKHELRRKGRIEQPLTPIAAELIGSHGCESLGSVGKGNSPVLSLCRSLLAAGFNPDQALDVYPPGTPALRVKSLRADVQPKMPSESSKALCSSSMNGTTRKGRKAPRSRQAPRLSLSALQPPSAPKLLLANNLDELETGDFPEGFCSPKLIAQAGA